MSSDGGRATFTFPNVSRPLNSAPATSSAVGKERAASAPTTTILPFSSFQRLVPVMTFVRSFKSIQRARKIGRNSPTSLRLVTALVSGHCRQFRQPVLRAGLDVSRLFSSASMPRRSVIQPAARRMTSRRWSDMAWKIAEYRDLRPWLDASEHKNSITPVLLRFEQVNAFAEGRYEDPVEF